MLKYPAGDLVLIKGGGGKTGTQRITSMMVLVLLLRGCRHGGGGEDMGSSLIHGHGQGVMAKQFSKPSQKTGNSLIRLRFLRKICTPKEALNRN